MYKEQAEERYSSLIGHESPTRSSWLDTLGLGLGSGVEGDYIPPTHRGLTPDDHKYFFAINLYNSFDIIPDLFATLFRVAAILGYHNVYVSIYENGSTDQTKALLRIFDALCRSVGLRVTIRTSMRTRGAFNHRIEYLAEVRNAAFVPLHELRDAENEYFDSIIFMNDVLPCVDDLLELIWQSRRNNAGITCAADYMYHEELVRHSLHASHLHTDRVASARATPCSTTTGSRATSTAPRSRTRLSRRSSTTARRRTGSSGTCPSRCSPAGTVSRCSTRPPSTRRRTYASAWRALSTASAPRASVRSSATTTGRRATDASSWSPASSSRTTRYVFDVLVSHLILRPVAYPSDGYIDACLKQRVYDIIHPSRRNLTAIRGYVRLGGLPDNPRTDPQDRAWFGPHDRLFTDEESIPLDFVPGPEYGASPPFFLHHGKLSRLIGIACCDSVVLGMGRRRGPGRARRRPDLGTHAEQVDEPGRGQDPARQEHEPRVPVGGFRDNVRSFVSVIVVTAVIQSVWALGALYIPLATHIRLHASITATCP